MMRAWQGGFGTVAVAGMVSPAYVVARPKMAVETAYIEHLLPTSKAIEQMRRHSRGITDFRLRLYWDEFKNLGIAIPPNDEARAICSEIAEMENRLSNLTATCEKSIDLLQERRTALISAAVTGQIDVRNLHCCAARPVPQGSITKRGVRIVWAAPRQPSPNWDDQEEDVVVWVSVLAMDAAWKLDNDNYIEPGGNGAALDDRYQRFGKWLFEAADPVELSVISIENGVVGFTDGRHRFAWLRDQGMSAMGGCARTTAIFRSA